MAKVILRPLEENDPIFKRGAVCFNPYSVRDSLKSRMDSSKPEAPKDIGLTPIRVRHLNFSLCAVAYRLKH